MKSFSKTIKTLSIYVIVVFSSNPIAAQCPQDSAELILNTQEKHDLFFESYPNCDEFTIVMMNGVFVGDPRPRQYVTVLAMIFVAVLLFLKILFFFILKTDSVN